MVLLVWSGPLVTFGKPPAFWVGAGHEPPLPTVTTAEKDRGSDLIDQAELASIDGVVATWAVW